MSRSARFQSQATRSASAAWIIWRRPFLRAAFLALFVAGLAVSSTTPQMTLYLVNELGASVPVAGLYYLTNFAAPLAGYWLGSLSDRQENRLTLFRVCALFGGFGWLAMALATRVWMPFVVAAVVLSFSGGSMGLLFAAVRDDLSRQHSPAADRVVSAVRMAFTAGWIIGPVLGSWFGAVHGLRPLLLVTAMLTAGQILPLGVQRVRRHVGDSRPASDSDGVEAPVAQQIAALSEQLAAVETELAELAVTRSTTALTTSMFRSILPVFARWQALRPRRTPRPPRHPTACT